ncbi:hypothetical protein BpHYR1_043138 [Brachionus plicatilis]|uniref:Uncharacterized protein n=1 Tax=Brachionus plicatilis TaxID=10195 RepID=A0A3M7S081_BRAPC|nr:hypothetical protein BpHYR1_043138 [Brachionus plicatilis]
MNLSFDEMIKFIFITNNENSLTLSSCNCWYWFKNNKFYHVTAGAAPSKGIESDDDSSDEIIQENVSKRPKIDSVTQEMFCEKIRVKMTKRRYWACPNKCVRKKI